MTVEVRVAPSKDRSIIETDYLGPYPASTNQKVRLGFSLEKFARISSRVIESVADRPNLIWCSSYDGPNTLSNRGCADQVNHNCCVRLGDVANFTDHIEKFLPYARPHAIVIERNPIGADDKMSVKLKGG